MIRHFRGQWYGYPHPSAATGIKTAPVERVYRAALVELTSIGPEVRVVWLPITHTNPLAW